MIRRFLPYVCLLVFALLAVPVFGQAASPRPYHDGTVWSIGFIHVKGGMERTYLNYIATDWKREQEALKKEGMLISYMVIQTEAHSSTDFNLMLMSEYKDMTTMEANQAKADALMEKLFGNDEKVVKGYMDRSLIRDLVGDRLGREIVLEPKP